MGYYNPRSARHVEGVGTQERIFSPAASAAAASIADGTGRAGHEDAGYVQWERESAEDNAAARSAPGERERERRLRDSVGAAVLARQRSVPTPQRRTRRGGKSQ